MLPEVMAAISPKDGETIIDCTFGGGSYSCAFLDQANCNVIGLDRDESAILRGNEIAKNYDNRLKLIHTPFSQLANLNLGLVDAIVMDIGVSSFQIDQAERGFSFTKSGPLDMRMGDGETASDILATRTESELTKIFWDYGEEKNARRIARAIVNDREIKPFTNTIQLAELCGRVYGRTKEKINPATRVFQALRIYVNDELGELETALKASLKMLKSGGRLVVVSFHSLEDRIVKNFFNLQTKAPSISRFAPVNNDFIPEFALITKKAQIASEDELLQNPRSRSAKLRAMMKI